MLKRIKLNEPSNVVNDYPSISFLIDDKHALSTDGTYIYLYGIVEDPNEPGAYIRSWSEVVHFAIDDQRTFAGLEQAVQALKEMSAYTLLTKHHNPEWSTFFINRSRDYVMSFEEGVEHPAIDLSAQPVAGKDY